jgi:hypothetical protein
LFVIISAMTALTYESLKNKPKTLRAMTSLRRAEFEDLLDTFAKVWEEDAGGSFKDASKGGRPPIIENMADRLLFILFYLKTYPLQEVIAHLFGMSQSQANFTIHHLSAILNKALDAKGHKPARLTDEMLSRLGQEHPQDLGIDGTERRINRPADPVGQRTYYSGKKNAIR